MLISKGLDFFGQMLQLLLETCRPYFSIVLDRLIKNDSLGAVSVLELTSIFAFTLCQVFTMTNIRKVKLIWQTKTSLFINSENFWWKCIFFSYIFLNKSPHPFLTVHRLCYGRHKALSKLPTHIYMVICFIMQHVHQNITLICSIM